MRCQPRFLHFVVEVYQLFRQDLCVLQACGRGTERAHQREGGVGMEECEITRGTEEGELKRARENK